MKAEEATFCFLHDGESNVVTFHFNDAGKPSTVSVDRGDRSIEVENKGGRWKPCVTHSKALIRWAARARPASNFEKERAETTRLKLRIFSD